MPRWILVTTALAGLVISPALAAPNPATWNYSRVGNVSTATYPGVVTVRGEIAATEVEINKSNYKQPPNYAGTNNSPVTVISGSDAAPSANGSASAFVEKFSSAPIVDGTASAVWKYSGAANARASAYYGEAVDTVGGITSYVEGGRFQGTLLSGSNGSSYGLVCAAGAGIGSTSPDYVIGCEGNTINQKGPDAPDYTSFNPNAFSAAFVATNGCAGCGAFKADAGIVINPNNETPFRTGLYIGAGSTDSVGVAFAPGLSMASGIDMGNSTLSYSAIILPNNTPIRAKNGAGNAELDIFSMDSANILKIGSQALRIDAVKPVILATYTVATLPTCNGVYEGAIAAVSDATAPTYNGALVGGGTVKVPVFCNGSAWTSH